MKILVTGGAGFIGSHIVDGLLKSGHEVVIVDNLSTGFRGNVNPRATFYETDLLHPQTAEIFSREKPDIVDHHAGHGNVREAVANPSFDARQNIMASLRVIELCRENNVRKIIFSSTGGAVYGEPAYLPVNENHPIRPLSPYGISKHTVERYLDFASANFGLNYTILRYANVYGPRQNPHGESGVIAIFADKMFKGERPIIFADGNATRDYVFVQDVVQANLLALEAGDQCIYNVATCRQVSINEIFNELRRVIGIEIEAIHVPPKPGEVDRICLTYDKIQKDLGWKPLTSLENGLAKTVDYYRPTYLSDKIESKS